MKRPRQGNDGLAGQEYSGCSIGMPEGALGWHTGDMHQALLSPKELTPGLPSDQHKGHKRVCKECFVQSAEGCVSPGERSEEGSGSSAGLVCLASAAPDNNSGKAGHEQQGQGIKGSKKAASDV